MKKLLVILITLLVSSVVWGQDAVAKKETKHFLTIQGGPSFPVSPFSGTSLSSGLGGLSNNESGFAKTGYTVALDYTLMLNKQVGIGAAFNYNNNHLNTGAYVKELNRLLDKELITADFTGLKLDHWQWYSLTAGPALNLPISKKLDARMRVMGGIAYANSPKASYQGIMLVNEDWSYAAILQTGMGLQYNVNRQLFLALNGNFHYLRPEFTTEYDNEGTTVKEKTHQKLSAVNLTAGVGIRF